MPSLGHCQFAEEFRDLTRAMIDDVATELPPARRAALAQRLTQQFIRLWGGSYLYIPVGTRIDTRRGVSAAGNTLADRSRARARRETRIRAEHDENDPLSVHRLARRYGLSEIAVYRILSNQPLADLAPAPVASSPA